MNLGEFSAYLGHFICCSEALCVSDSPKYNQAKSSHREVSGLLWKHMELGVAWASG